MDIRASVFIGLAAGLAWFACVIICILKGKIWSAIIGIVSAVAIAIGWRIGRWEMVNPLMWVPVIAAIRLGRPDSLWAYWFYSDQPQKYARAVLKYDLSANLWSSNFSASRGDRFRMR